MYLKYFDNVKTDLSTHGLRNIKLFASTGTDQRYYQALQISTMEFFEKAVSNVNLNALTILAKIFI